VYAATEYEVAMPVCVLSSDDMATLPIRFGMDVRVRDMLCPVFVLPLAVSSVRSAATSFGLLLCVA
jgi:hypothetical protein